MKYKIMTGMVAAVLMAAPAHADPAPPAPSPNINQETVPAPPPPGDPLNAFLSAPEAPLTTDGDVLSEDIYIIL